MAASTWKLIAAALGSDADTREVIVEGENWLAALRSAREALGEAGGVPPGASCVMNAEGGVTILDGMARRRYDLIRLADATGATAAAGALQPAQESAASSSPGDAEPPIAEPPIAALPIAEPPIAEPPIVALPIAEPPMMEPPIAASHAQTRPEVPVAKANAESARASSDMDASPAAVEPASAPGSSGVPLPPVLFTPPSAPAAAVDNASTLPTPFAVSRPPTRPSRPALAPVTAPAVGAPPDGSAPRPAQLRRHPSGPGHAPVRPRSLSPLPASAPSGPDLAQPPLPLAPADVVAPAARGSQPAAAEQRSAGLATRSAVVPGSVSAAGPIVLLTGRDEDPRPQSPLTYRERSYLVVPGTSEDDLELALRVTLSRLQEELNTRPRGQLVVLAAFDHSFSQEPERGPIATLQWKDWRGEAVFELTSSAGATPSRPDLGRTSFMPSAMPSAVPAAAASVPAAAASVPAAAASVPAAAASHKPPPSWAPPSPGAVPFVPSVSPFAAASAPPAPASAPGSADFGPSAFPYAQPVAPPATQFPFAPPAAAAFGQPAPYAQPPAPYAQPPAPYAQPPAPVAADFGQPSPFAVPAPMGIPTNPAPALGAPTHQVSAHAPMPVQAPPAARVPRATIGYMAAPIGQTADSTGEQDQRLAQAFESVQDLYFLATPAAGLEFVIQLLGELLPSEASSASLYDINTDHLRCVAAAGVGAETRRAQAIPGSSGLLGVAVRGHRESLVLNDVRSDPRFIAGLDSYAEIAARDMVFFPLIVGVQLVGMLQLINRVGRPHFSEADAAVGAYVAAQAAKFVMDHRNRRDA